MLIYGRHLDRPSRLHHREYEQASSELNVVHELSCALKLPVATEDAVDQLRSSYLAHILCGPLSFDAL
jgi:hypothetical protein